MAQPGQGFECRKCGGKQCTFQVRQTKVMVGGVVSLQAAGAAQWTICSKCGDQTLPFHFEYGEPLPFVMPEPPPQAPDEPQVPVDLRRGRPPKQPRKRR